MPIRVLEGHVLDVLPTLPTESVHCVVTSPPYWGLRAYGTEPQVWDGDPTCEHIWGAERTINRRGSAHGPNAIAGNTLRLVDPATRAQGAFCQCCGAWRGEWGTEPTFQLYVEHSVAVFAEVWRVLRKDGTCWVNLGDCYATGANGRSAADTKAAGKDDRTFRDKPFSTVGGVLKPKDLAMIPARFAIAMQEAGWWLRSDIAWCKRSPMPESISDRPTNAWEHIFLFAKASRYFYDAAAVREPTTGGAHSRGSGLSPKSAAPGLGIKANESFHAAVNEIVTERNMRNVWLLSTEPVPEAHFATFPSTIPERAIKAGTSEKGACPTCGAPWRRVTKTEYSNPGNRKSNGPRSIDRKHIPGGTAGYAVRLEAQVETTSWAPSCECPPLEPVPCEVLDICGGSGTTGKVAARLGRNATLIELKPEYAAMSRRRIRDDSPMFAEVS